MDNKIAIGNRTLKTSFSFIKVDIFHRTDTFEEIAYS